MSPRVYQTRLGYARLAKLSDMLGVLRDDPYERLFKYKRFFSHLRLKADESVKAFNDFAASVRPITRH
jgi:hypothetical protein